MAKRKITISKDKLVGDHTDFSLLVDVSSQPDIAGRKDVFFTDSGDVPIPFLALGASPWLTPDGAYIWYGEPQFVYRNNMTYAGWVNRNGDVVVGGYDHIGREWLTPVTLHTALDIDDHVTVAFEFLADGRVLVVYAGHNGTAVYQRTSANAEDIYSFGAEVDITSQLAANSVTYVSLHRTTNNLFLLWRNASHLYLSMSQDEGITWSSKENIYQSDGRRTYWQAYKDGSDRIHLVVSPTSEWATAESNLHHFYINDAGAGVYTLHKSDGSQIVTATPLAESDITLVWDAAQPGNDNVGPIFDLGLDGAGNPVATFATRINDDEFDYRYAIWDGITWAVHLVEGGVVGHVATTEPTRYTGQCTLDDANHLRLWLSRPVNGTFEMHQYDSSDGGQTWSVQQLSFDSRWHRFRPVKVRGSNGELPFVYLFGYYGNIAEYATVIGSSIDGWRSSDLYLVKVQLAAGQDDFIYVHWAQAGTPHLAAFGGAFGDDAALYLAGHKYPGVINPLWPTDAHSGLVYEPNGTVSEVAGQRWQAIHFGGGRLEVVDSSYDVDMAGWDAFTIEVWVRQTAAAGNQTIFRNWSPTTGGVILRTEGGVVVIRVRVDGQVTLIETAGEALTIDQWQRVVARYDSTTGGLAIFIDKAKYETAHAPGQLVLNAQSVNGYIGNNSGMNQPFSGQMEQICIYETAKSDQWLDATYDMWADVNFLAFEGGGPCAPTVLSVNGTIDSDLVETGFVSLHGRASVPGDLIPGCVNGERRILIRYDDRSWAVFEGEVTALADFS